MGLFRNLALFLYRKIERRPWLYRTARGFLDRNPALKAFLKGFLFDEQGSDERFFRGVKSLDPEERFFLKKLKSFRK